MYKYTITYEDFSGENVTETLYFNLTKTEAMGLASKENGKYTEILKNIADIGNPQRILEVFSEIVLMSYGERSEDGRKFIKNDRIREEFRCSAAYDEFMTKVMTDMDFAVNFVNLVIPTKGINAMVDKLTKEKKALEDTNNSQKVESNE